MSAFDPKTTVHLPGSHMKRFYILVFLFPLMLLGLHQTSRASHGMGVDISYQCMGNCTIRIHWTGYRDCGGSTLGAPTGLTIAGGTGCTNPVGIGNWSTPVITEVTPICPGTPTRCTTPGAAVNGVQQYYSFRDYNFCAANCSTYTISWSLCCRNAAITSINNPGSQNIGTFSTTINPFINPCNNSPVFNNPPVPYICAGQPYVFNQGATDPDGDSLVYYLGPCYTSAGVFLPYNATGGFTPTTPMGNDWIVSLDSFTGDLSIIPNPASPSPGSIQVGVLCVYVNEYRNDTLLGSVVRDIQITVIPCPGNNQPSSPGVTNLTGGSVPPNNNYSVVTCAGANICFDIPWIDVDSNPAQPIKIWWNQTLAGLGATFTSVTLPTQTDTIRDVTGDTVWTRFCWNNVPVGVHTFLATARDSSCPIFGQAQYTFTIRVSQSFVSWNDTTFNCGYAEFCIDSASGIPPLTYNWSGSGGLSSIDSCFNYTFPGPGSYPYVLTITDSAGCQRVLNDTMLIPNTVSAIAGPNQVTCSGDPVTIGGPSTTDEIYNWTPTTFLSNPTASTTTVTPINNTTAPIILTYIVHAFDTLTLCEDWDTVTVTVNPIPNSTFNLPPEVCIGDPVQVSYAGWNNSGATYNWTFGPSGVPSTASGQGPHTVSWNAIGMQPVTLEVINLGCTSAVTIDSIMVHPFPVAAIAPVADQCFAGHSFNFTNNGTYGNAANFTWAFTPNATPSGSTAENPTGVTFANVGPAAVTLQIEEHGCVSNLATDNFMLFPDPSPNFAYVGGPQCLSMGNNSYQFNASGNNGPSATYSWTFQNGVPATSALQNPAAAFTQAGWNHVILTVTENGCVSTRLDSVLVYPDPVFDAGPDKSFCEGEGGVILNGSGTGGTTPYYYSWWCQLGLFCGLDSVNDNDPNANPNVSAMYYGQITDFNGCTSNIDSTFVTVIPKPIVDAGPDIVICRDSAPCQLLTPNVTGSPGPFSYQWSPSIGLNNDTIASPCAHPDTTTIYTLVVVDRTTGCSSAMTTVDTNATVTVHRPPLPVAEAGPDRDLCLGDSLMLQGYGYAAGPAYDFEWSPFTGLSNPNIPNPMAGPTFTIDYVLTVWSNGCPSIGDTVTVNVHTNPTVDAGPDQEICLNETAVLHAIANGDSTATYTYNWTPTTGVVGSAGVQDLNASPSQTTTYYVVATSNYGCESPADSATVYLKPTPIAEAGPQQQICFPDTVQLLGSWSSTTGNPNPTQVYYAWTPGITLSDTTIATPAAWPSNSQFYYLTVRYNTCSTTDSVLVTVFPEIGLMAESDTSVACEGNSIQLYAEGGLGGAQFTWSPSTGLSDPNIANPVATPSQSTVYTVVATEGICSESAQVAVEILPNPEAAYLSSPTDGCLDHTVSFLETSSGELHYVWNFGDGQISNQPNPSHTYTQPGTYTVSLTVVSPGNCMDEVNDIVVNVIDWARSDFGSSPDFPALLSLPNTTVLFFDKSEDAVSWHWEFGDGTVSDEQNPVHTYVRPGEYEVKLTVTNDLGCATTIIHGPYIVGTPDLFIPNVFSPNDDGTNDEFIVQYTGSQPYNVKIFDRWGAQLYESNNKVAGWDGLNDSGERAPEGVYFYRVAIGDKTYAGSVTLVR